MTGKARIWTTLLAGVALCGCAQDTGVRLEALLATEPAATLDAYGLFADASASIPVSGVLAYDLNTPLYSDGATKHRFVWMPEGRAAGYAADDVLAMPVGTVLVKTFAYPTPDGGERKLETRLLIHQETGWVARPYVWNEAGTEARYAPAGARLQAVRPVGAGIAPISWQVPNANQCKTCHQAGKADISPIGPTGANLNRPAPGPAPQTNQLTVWQQAGYLAGAPEPEAAARLADWSDATASLDARARAYLAMNCGHCHKPDGSASNSGLVLTATATDPRQLGIGKRPVAAGRGAGERLFDIVPGQPDQSIMVYRMESTDPGIRMPELGRVSVHEEGVTLVRDWISGMQP